MSWIKEKLAWAVIAGAAVVGNYTPDFVDPLIYAGRDKIIESLGGEVKPEIPQVTSNLPTLPPPEVVIDQDVSATMCENLKYHIEKGCN